jgi:uroporphyrin-III C-methyltransferase
MIVGTLTNIATKIKIEKMSPPANIIIGEVVKLHKIIGWKK